MPIEEEPSVALNDVAVPHWPTRKPKYRPELTKVLHHNELKRISDNL